MGIVACHAVELFTACCVTTTPGQRGSRKPDRVGLVRRELAARLLRAMALSTEPDDGRAGCQGRTPDGEVGVLTRSKILGSYNFQVISGRPMAPLAADRAIRRLGACAGQDGVRIGVVALKALAHVIDADMLALIKRRLLVRLQSLAGRYIPGPRRSDSPARGPSARRKADGLRGMASNPAGCGQSHGIGIGITSRQSVSFRHHFFTVLCHQRRDDCVAESGAVPTNQRRFPPSLCRYYSLNEFVSCNPKFLSPGKQDLSYRIQRLIVKKSCAESYRSATRS
jgi:hypothetical protein